MARLSQSGYNEIVVSWSEWERQLPWGVEAFVFGGGERAWKANFRRICEHQANFLAKYGLTAEEVPVLRYDCGPGGPHGGHPFTPATAPVGKCFVQVPC